jgi:uncharacterized RDD family membrane protein YckC
MIGFCKDCGKPLGQDGTCSSACAETTAPVGHYLSPREPDALAAAAAALAPQTIVIGHDVGPLPKASTLRRLIGSGVEYFCYLVCVWLLAAAALLTFGVSALLTLFPIAFIALRDCNAGAFSLAKRISRMRVVNVRSGAAASNAQALFRNSYYLGLLVLATILPWFTWLYFFAFTAFVMLDVLMILASPQGRRLGDMLAGTQVVEARR